MRLLCMPWVVFIAGTAQRHDIVRLQVYPAFSEMSIGGSLLISNVFEAGTGSRFIPASTYCQQRSSVLDLSSMYLPCSDLEKAAVGSIDPKLMRKAFVI